MQIGRGSVLNSRYVVQSQIGSGGMAIVYRGLDQKLDRLVAIKVMLERYAQDASFAARFKQEAQAAAALQSPYIVSVYDWGQEGDTYYIVMEYLRGTDLKSGIRSHGALTPRKVAQIGAQVCQALSVAHAHDIIHRDIKPQNIMIQQNGDAKVMDFGIARSKNSHLTQTNSVLGTAHYVSPEQAQGKPLGPTSDLYSLGVVMYEAATGRLPFDGDDAVSVALKQVNDEPVPPSELNPNVDDDLNNIIMKCMMKNPDARFQSADELRHVLNSYIMGRPVNLGGAAATSVLGGTASATSVLSRTMAGARGAVGMNSSARSGRTGRMQVLRGNGMNSLGGSQNTRSTRMMPAASHNGAGGGAGASAAGGPGAGFRTGSGGPGSGSQHTVLFVTLGIVAVIALVLALLFAVRACSGGLGSSSGSGSGSSSSSSTSSAASSSASAVTVTVPTLTGMTVSQATSTLSSLGLTLGTQTTQESSTVTRGQIISQTPAANSSTTQGSSVDVVVSSGSSNSTLPTNAQLQGLSEEEARQLLTRAGVTPVHDSSLDAYSDSVGQGLFLTLDPAVANSTSVTKGSTVRYGLSLGAEPAYMPAVTGLYYTDAETAVNNAQLNWLENWVNDDSVAQGVVLYADVSEGTSLNKWSTVTLTISSGPATVSVPSVVGMSLRDAENAIIAAGLNYALSGGAVADTGAATVTSSSPAPGASVQRGSTVTLSYTVQDSGDGDDDDDAADDGAGSTTGGGSESGSGSSS